MILQHLRPMLHAKWEADSTQPDFITGYTQGGTSYLVVAPIGIRDLLVTMQNNLSMQLRYIDALERERDQAIAALIAIAEKTESNNQGEQTCGQYSE